MKKYQKILLYIFVGVIILPTFALGSSFVSSLLQGKTIPEAIQILAEQIDLLIDRVIKIETKQSEQEQTISQLQQQNACLKKETLFQKAKSVSGVIDAELITTDDILSANLQKLLETQNLSKTECNEKTKECKNISHSRDKEINHWQNKVNELEQIQERYTQTEKTCDK